MKAFYEKTMHFSLGYRDTRLHQASKYMEREQLKLKQIHRQISSIEAYRIELVEKRQFLAGIKENYPHVDF